MSIFNWIKNLFAPAKQETLVLTDVVEKKAAPAKKKAAPKKDAANKTPAKKGRPKKTSK